MILFKLIIHILINNYKVIMHAYADKTHNLLYKLLEQI